jgi:hypothetical protein
MCSSELLQPIRENTIQLEVHGKSIEIFIQQTYDAENNILTETWMGLEVSPSSCVETSSTCHLLLSDIHNMVVGEEASCHALRKSEEDELYSKAVGSTIPFEDLL